jgi:two-component system OmpR family response regulator
MLAGVRILLVADAPDEAAIYCLAFGLYGATVVWAVSVAQALEAVARGPVDVVVSDLLLRDRGGLKLVRALRAAGVTAPAVALAGDAARLLGPEAREAGFDLYCAKPCPPTELAAAIAVLRRKAHAAAGMVRAAR